MPTSRYLLVSILLVLLPLSGSAENPRQPKELTMGVFPREPGTTSLLAFSPLARHLGEKLGLSVRLVLSKDYDAFLKKLDQGTFDLVHLNHAHYIRSRSAGAYQVVGVNQEFGSNALRAAIYVRKDSSAASVADLRGKTIIFGGDRTAFIAYQAGQKLLRDHGLSPADYRERTSINPPSAVIALARGQADAAVAGDGLLLRPLVRQAVDVDSVRILAVSEPYPGLPWAVKRTLPGVLREAVARTLLGLHESDDGRRALEAAGIDRVLPAADRDFDAVEDLVRSGRRQGEGR